MLRTAFRHQRTIRTAKTVSGVGIVGGKPVTLRFVPAPSNTGLVFVRTDITGRPSTQATADRVTDTRRRTTLGYRDTGVTLVEHVLAALAGMRVDNCFIELNGQEPPGLDGSAAGFMQALSEAQFVTQSSPRPIYTTTKPVTVCSAGATMTLYPADPKHPARLTASYMLDYGTNSPIPPQNYTTAVNPSGFAQVANSRTFLLEHEIDFLRNQGIGRHLTARDIVVFSPRGVLDNELRHANEPARHKVLDLIGDLALCGFDLAGHVVAYRSGHALNVELAKTLREKLADLSEEMLPQRVWLPQRKRAA
ncbi:MAG: UDP-3-O-acyl-N-acetylglucosamine deacetylase [Fimbriiglobus sp.]